MSSDLDRQAAVIARAATDLDQWAAEWAERWPEDTLTPLGMGDLAIDLRALLPQPEPTSDHQAETKHWVRTLSTSPRTGRPVISVRGIFDTPTEAESCAAYWRALYATRQTYGGSVEVEAVTR